MHVISVLAAVAATIASVLAGGSDTSALSTVKLDYTTVQAVGGNTTIGYYKYQNIRFAKAPTGDLRFAAPQWPDVENEINNGTTFATADVTCKTSEDCLYLDVWVPTNAADRNLPVMVWSYGGRFILGSKSDIHPEGLFDLSQDFVFVAYNYRLGLTGVATGPTFQHEGGVSNVCIWDATHAFEWVQKYIKHFGGNPDDVTAVGFSAGGSQIGFQMTRFAGNAPQLFHKAYIMSPGYLPSAGHHQAEQFWQNVSSAVGCGGGHLDCMRKVDFDTLVNATNTIVAAYKYTLQPRVDGFILPDTYEASVYQGHFNFSGPTVLTHEQHEFNSAAYTGVTTEADIAITLRTIFQAITDSVIDDLLDLYPAEHYANPGLRLNDIRQSYEITAKNLALTNALSNQTWNAEVGLSPAVHGTDQSYYWYSTYNLTTTSDGVTTSVPTKSTVNATTARAMQKYLLSFVITGDPNELWADEQLYWPRYNQSSTGTEIVFNETFYVADDDLANSKSLYLNKVLWY